MYQEAHEFIEIYNQLDQFLAELLRKRKDLTGSEPPDHVPFFRKIDLLVRAGRIGGEYQGELRSFGNLRNAIVHETDRSGSGQPIANPLDRTVDRFAKLSEAIMRPPKAMDHLLVRLSEMLWVERSSLVIEAMRRMSRHQFSYLPILEDRRLVGVFSQDTLFSKVVMDEGFLLESDLTMEEFGPLLDPMNHANERFEFLGRASTIRQVEERFADRSSDKRLEVIFFTENGRVQEKLLGMTTIWDLVAYRADGDHLV